MNHRPRRLGHALGLVALCLLAAPASATWSIVLVDRSTGEVCAATATCIANEELRRFVPVVRVGHGAGAEQYIVDPSGRNKLIMWNGLAAGLTPAEILDDLLFGNGTQPGRRQYGLAALNGPAVTWTGGQAAPGKNQLTGELGDISFAVQGNSLTGPEVITAAWEALMQSTGDSGERVLAGMLAAASLGGDGRCSCNAAQPTSCGVPPPNFRKSAHTVVMIVARMGDTDGVCNSVEGCANGDYYLDLEVIGDASDPDPILELEQVYLGWRAALSGRPDHLRSRVVASAQSLPADGESKLVVRVRLIDVDGVPLTSGGAEVSVGPLAPHAKSLVGIGPVQDHGDGTYSFVLQAGKRFGTQELAIVADDGVVRATLWPYLSISLEGPGTLHTGFRKVSTSAPQPVPFTIAEPRAPHAPYVLLGSRAESLAGLALGRTSLGPDAWLAPALEPGLLLERRLGVLDARGRALALWQPRPELALLGHERLTWTALVLGDELLVTNPVALELGP